MIDLVNDFYIGHFQNQPSGVPGHRTTKSINPPGQYWYTTKILF